MSKVLNEMVESKGKRLSLYLENSNIVEIKAQEYGSTCEEIFGIIGHADDAPEHITVGVVACFEETWRNKKRQRAIFRYERRLDGKGEDRVITLVPLVNPGFKNQSRSFFIRLPSGLPDSFAIVEGKKEWTIVYYIYAFQFVEGIIGNCMFIAAPFTKASIEAPKGCWENNNQRFFCSHHGSDDNQGDHPDHQPIYLGSRATLKIKYPVILGVEMEKMVYDSTTPITFTYQIENRGNVKLCGFQCSLLSEREINIEGFRTIRVRQAHVTKEEKFREGAIIDEYSAIMTVGQEGCLMFLPDTHLAKGTYWIGKVDQRGKARKWSIS